MLRLLRRTQPAALVALACAVLAGVETRAGAAPTDAELTQARERFVAARKLEDAGHWSEALATLQRVAEVKMTPQVRFHIALCMENVGLWTQALDGFSQAAAEAGTAAPDVVKEAKEHTQKLMETMPTVSVSVDGAAAGDELLLDRRKLPIDDRPLPIRADPGPHTAEVRRAGSVLAREFFALEPRSTRRIELRIGTIAPEPAEPPKPPAPAPTAAPRGTASAVAPPPPTAAPPEPAPGRVQRGAGWASVGVGGTSLILAGVFIGLRAGALNRLTDTCPSFTQGPAGVASTVSEGKTDATLVNVFGILGGVATAAGVVLLLADPRPAATAPPRTPPASAWIEIRTGGVGLGGRF